MLIRSKFISSKSSLVLGPFLATLVFGGVLVFAQEKSSEFYATYDVQDLVENGAYKGIDFAYGGAGFESVEELRKGGIERTKDTSYDCRIETTSDSKFDLADFLNWLAGETKKRIERSRASVAKEEEKNGKSFYLEYKGKDFRGRVEIDGEIIRGNQLNLNVKVTESRYGN